MQLFGIDSELDRLELRALRASPPGLARADRARRRVCAAALGQFDELLTASGAVGPATAPLPLYYALNQGGRAIAAAYEPDPQRWETKRHGLSVGDPVPSLGATLVTPWRPGRGRPRNDSFSMMANAVGSPLLSDKVRLDELWAAAPGIVRPTKGLGASKPRALQLAPVQLGNMPVMARLTDIDIGRLPKGGRTAALRRRLERSYPSTRSPEMRLGTGVIEARHEARLSWQTSSGAWRILDDVAPRFPAPSRTPAVDEQPLPTRRRP